MNLKKKRMLIEAGKSLCTFSSSKFSQAVDSAFNEKTEKQNAN